MVDRKPDMSGAGLVWSGVQREQGGGLVVAGEHGGGVVLPCRTVTHA